VFADIDGPTHPYMESTPGCWAAYGEVLAREYGSAELMEIHRLSVDTYAIQHPGHPSRQAINSVNLHLIRLFMRLERGLPEERSNDVMRGLTQRKREFHWLEPPASRGTITVANVARCIEPERHKAAVREWARSALDAWRAHLPMIEKWADGDVKAVR
jgi:hypothetical protein